MIETERVRQTGRRTSRQVGRQTDGQPGRQAGRQTDRRTDRGEVVTTTTLPGDIHSFTFDLFVSLIYTPRAGEEVGEPVLPR